jgi:PadR family transcriptional regulator, regulatory protein PadR
MRPLAIREPLCIACKLSSTRGYAVAAFSGSDERGNLALRHQLLCPEISIAASMQASGTRRARCLQRFVQFGACASSCRLPLTAKGNVVDSFSPVDRLKECMPPSKSEVLQGTLDLLVPETLDSMGPTHGFGIALRIRQISEDLLAIEPGNAVSRPAASRTARLDRWGVSENNCRAKYYSLTRAGRKQLEEKAESWGAHDRDDSSAAESKLAYACIFPHAHPATRRTFPAAPSRR